ncbi:MULTISPECIES: copper chaperone PCu(A)C [Kitasatospora]|uniref:Copper chaperone PCu(A)C n=1 Tax=Kitasatospora cystarginea TaxID=58350 RepID=A0ABP5QIT3_9ACTN
MKRAALPPLAAAAACLVLLSGWTAFGGAGRARPVRAEGTGWILLPAGAGPASAFLTVRNPGDVPDELTGVSWDRSGRLALKEHRMLGATGSWSYAPTVTVPARGELAMSPDGADILISDPPALRAGQWAEFTLRFRRSPELRVRARAVRAGELSAVLGRAAG